MASMSRIRNVLLLGIGITSLTLTSATPSPSTPQISTQEFDYIIVGAGAAGLLLANRLSANPDISVALIEAGDSVFDNKNVSNALAFTSAFGTAIDYAYPSAPQKYSNGTELIYNAGKALGGTTTINGMTYIRAEKAQIDLWASLGNPGWDWESLWPFYLQHEGFQRPSKELQDRGASFEEGVHGEQGEVKTGWNQNLTGQGIEKVLRDTSERLGISWNKDPNGGVMRGFSTWPMTQIVDGEEEPIRADAARAFYFPVKEQRSNLKVFLNTTALRVVWDEGALEKGEVVAKGVEIVETGKNKTEILFARDEVILSAGSIRSPALLEHSGIGNRAVLEPLGIKTVVDLPGVGANLQDQPNSFIAYNSTMNYTGYPNFVTYLTALDLFGDDVEAVGEVVRNNISTWAERIVSDLAPNDTTVSIQTHLLTLQTDLLFTRNSTVPLAEIVWFPLPTTLGAAFWNLLPFSRGSIHIASSDPSLPPSINANFWQADLDIQIQTLIARRIRQYFGTPPLSSLIDTEVLPGFETVPRRSPTDAQYASWIKGAYATNNHPIGTTAMMSRDLGGVVDSEAKVYGVKGLRVVDAGTLPMQVSGHLMANIYAVSGKVAEGILEGRGR